MPHITFYHVNPKTFLFKQGDAATSFFIICIDILRDVDYF